jgi:hypothetical protein
MQEGGAGLRKGEMCRCLVHSICARTCFINLREAELHAVVLCFLELKTEGCVVPHAVYEVVEGLLHLHTQSLVLVPCLV